jgi:hypothetical protein
MEEEREYLAQHVFKDLTDINDGFDAPMIKYFSQADFQVVLERVEKLGIGLHGIEPWRDGKYFKTVEFEDYGIDQFDPNWYKSAFVKLIGLGEELQYSASYDVPEELLDGL